MTTAAMRGKRSEAKELAAPVPVASLPVAPSARECEQRRQRCRSGAVRAVPPRGQRGGGTARHGRGLVPSVEHEALIEFQISVTGPKGGDGQLGWEQAVP